MRIYEADRDTTIQESSLAQSSNQNNSMSTSMNRVNLNSPNNNGSLGLCSLSEDKELVSDNINGDNKNDSKEGSMNGLGMDSSLHITQEGSFVATKEKDPGMNDRSVRFATGTAFESSPKRNTGMGGSGRVASIKAKLRSSFSASNSSLRDGESSIKESGQDSFNRSWGGALTNLDEIGDLSDSDEEGNSGEDDDSFGAAELGDLADTGNDMDASENFRARARQSISFNMSFMNVAEDVNDEYDEKMKAMNDKSTAKLGASSRRRQTGRGSIFIIADEKFGQTKVVQKRLEKAALKIQAFLRRSLLVLRHFNAEKDYLLDEIRDTESRRVEELAAVPAFIEEEKEQIRMELEQEYNPIKMTPEEWDAYLKEADEMRAQIAQLKEENNTFKKDCKELKHENDKLEVIDPEILLEKFKMEREVRRLEKDIDDWSRIGGRYKESCEQAQQKIDEVTEKRKAKRAERKKTEKTIKKIIKLMEENKPKLPAEGDKKKHDDAVASHAKLIDKVKKMKSKRDRKIEKLKARTVAEINGEAIPEEKDDKKQKESDKKKEKDRKSKRKSTKSKDDDMPELGGMDNSLKSKSKSTKSKDDDMPDMAGMDNSSKSKSKSTKSKDDDMPDLAGMDNSSKSKSKSSKSKDDDMPDLAGMDSSSKSTASDKKKDDKKKDKKDKKEKEKKEKKDKEKKDKEKKKETEKKEKERKRRESQLEGDDALMMMFKIQQEKEQAEKKVGLVVIDEKTAKTETDSDDSDDDDDDVPRPKRTEAAPGGGALMSLIAG